jgi:signal transduction histidine kinase/FixJ family two-component response regulator
LLASVILYCGNEPGLETVMVSGATVPLEQRPLANGRILFPLGVGAGDILTAYLRVSGPMAVADTLEIWQPAAYAETAWRILLLKAVVVTGAVSIVVLVSLYFWQRARHAALLAVGIGDGLFGVATLMFDGLGAGWLPADADFWSGRVTGMLVLLGIFFHVVFARAFLELPKVAPGKDKAMIAIALLSLVAAGAQAFTGELKLLTFQGALAVAVSATVVVVLVARQGVRNAGLYLLAWLSLLSVLLMMLAGALLKLPTVFYMHLLPLPSFLFSSLVLAFAMYREVELTRLSTERTHLHLRDLRRTEQERLTLAVESRTRELRTAKAQAEEAGKARLTFLSTVSHELRTPLHTILGYTQLLRKQNGRREADMKLATIERSGLQLLHLIDEILEFIRGDAQTMVLLPVPVSLADLARQTNDTGQVLALERRNRFSVELGDGLPETVEVDERRLLQVLDNMISNGCKYTADGYVTLRIESAPSVVSELPPDSFRLRFSVTDSGVGIPADQMYRLFEPFSRLVGNEYQPGLGLGLAIARQIVRAMDGEIEVDSEPGRGSCFHFSLNLPVVAGEGARRAVLSPQINGHAGWQRTLLVADDIAENREFLRDVCVEWGFRVLMASDGAEALTICRNAAVTPDCVLVDQFMPGTDGWTFLRDLRADEHLHSLPVILVSAAGPQFPAGVPAELAFDCVLLKPIRQHQLADALKELLGIEWTVADADCDPAKQNNAMELPSREDLLILREMLSLGRVVAIRHQAEQMAADRPELAKFANEVANLAEAVDLSGLDRLLMEVENGLVGESV